MSRVENEDDYKARKALERCIDRCKASADRYRDVARVNESFCNGDQWGGLAYKNGVRDTQRDTWFDAENVPRIYVNKLRNVTLTQASLLVRDRPAVKAVAATTEPEDTYRAAVADNVIRGMQDELDTAWKIQQVVISAIQGGTAGLKILYDREADSVSWSVITVFDYFIDPRVQNYQASPYLIFLDYRPLEEAEALWKDAKWEGRPNESQYKDAAGDAQSGVETFELWMKPSREWPQGLYACFVDGKIVERMDFPYVFETSAARPDVLYPFVLMKMRDIRGSSYGGTNLTDCIPLQRTLNEVNSRIVKMMRLTSNVICAIPREGNEGFKPNQDLYWMFSSAQADSARAMGFVKGFEIPPVLFSEREYYEAQINEVIGLNAITSGTKTRSISGRAIENIVELDAQKNADATKSLQDMVKAAWLLTLRLVQTYYTKPRMMRMTAGTEMDVLSFQGSDIAGVDVRLEPSSELDTYSETQQAKADERAVQGLPPVEMGQGQELRAASAADFAESWISQYLEGESTLLEPEDTDLGVFLDVLEKHIQRAAARNARDDWQALVNLRREVQAMQKRAAMAAPVEGAQEPEPPPGTPPGMQMGA